MDWSRIIDIFVAFGLAWILLRWSVADSINSTMEKEARSFLREIEFQRECVTNELRKIQDQQEYFLEHFDLIKKHSLGIVIVEELKELVKALALYEKGTTANVILNEIKQINDSIQKLDRDITKN